MDTILFPIIWVISWIMYGIHEMLVFVGMTPGSGPAWVLSIVGLTLVIRALTIPLFTKQIKGSRAMQELQPEMRKIQKKYKGRTDQISQRRQQEEIMALYKSRGTSPFSSCFPVLIQMPIFFSLYRLLYSVLPLSEGTYTRTALGAIDQDIAGQIADSTVFGAPLTGSIGTAGTFGDAKTRVIVVAVVLIALMIITLFISQRQLMMKNMPKSDDPNNPAEKMQKYMLYGMPLIYVFTGFAFQIGVLVYWLTSNIWNMGQQTWLIEFNPTPGSEAYKKRQAKLRARRIAKGLPPEEDEEELRPSGQRVQPVRKDRQKKGRPAGTVAAGAPVESNTQNDDAVVAQLNEPVRGKDGLTDAERAQKRYERRQAERQRSKAKKQAREKRQQQNKKQRNF
ncbi:MAG: membrane protein insertase YidC [Actinomycetaceae bacterium]|nr:membrane protein insertase YidC [Arcanobacterium sp.]MDD7505450.1 membrane protein insertase YidC [Actinomycetaceae bacterium]MDY6144051.1 membrane protein insertase YidC [Arcanobacterium sp.]